MTTRAFRDFLDRMTEVGRIKGRDEIRHSPSSSKNRLHRIWVAFPPGESEQTVVDKRTPTGLKQLVSLALEESSQGGVAWKRKEAKP